MVGIMGDGDLPDFVAKMQGFQRSDDERQKLLADVLHRYAALTEEHANLKNDYASERDIRRNYQRSVDHMQRQVTDTQRELFQDQLLQAAGNGGSEAASMLQHAIHDHIASIYSNSGNWSVMVNVYVSLDKLAQKLASVQLVRHSQDLRSFAQSFNVNQPLFNIIDVGQGKERADHKIKEMLRTFSDNPTCRHIIFGGCHDAGYLLNLDQYKHNAAKAARISLLESTPAQRGFVELPNFRHVKFDNIFRPDPLPEYSPQTYTQPPIQAPVAATAQASPVQLVRSMTNKKPSPSASPAPTSSGAQSVPMASSPSTTASSLAGQSTDSSGASWSTIGKTSSNPAPVTTNGNSSLAKIPKKKYVYYNKDGERLDEPLPPRDRAAAESIDKRMGKTGRNLCNHWHLNRGKCNQGDFCLFQHEPKLSASETNALRYKTRSLACKNRYCENLECYLGHQCSFERDQGRCPYPDTCNLRHTHGMDKVKYERWDENGIQSYAA
ncbi:hypothetical protein BS50DRAFT_620322 [Corynespora cassiicola Philippines]|uniref:C3H1-type domain-containing protein n=1 Tax=Corynespora cassiicola Philippines TaxID=1448308 RepID=A0A2T2NR05_CORCC|nr:hypothetical protein BS50DRAFT_620322 [Corynespora cassiicola Philippines]